MTNGTLKVSYIHLVNRKGTRCPKCMASLISLKYYNKFKRHFLNSLIYSKAALNDIQKFKFK